MKSILSWVIGAVLALLIVAGVWFFYLRPSSVPAGPSVSSATIPVSSMLSISNPDYSLAGVYQNQGNYALAVETYKKALGEVTDPAQKAQVLYNIAYATELSGDYVDAISQYKAIAADTTNYGVVRAYAVQEMGSMYYNNYGTAVRNEITNAVFQDPPYAAFKEGNTIDMAYVHLFEYAAGIYPVAYSDSRIAYGYANELITTLKGATTTPQGVADVTIVTQSISAADSDIQDRMKNVPSETYLIPSVLTREGTALADLASVGAANPTQAESYFQKGVQYAAVDQAPLGNFNAFNYAAFLVAEYGTSRSADVVNLLVPFKVGNDAQILPSVATFLQSVPADPTLTVERGQIVTMSVIDPAFKSYLISLGWKSSDFSK